MLALGDIKKLQIAVDIIYDECLVENNISVSMLRLDKIYAPVSGNKIFKLYYFLQQALASGHKKIITFGGAFSNHLHATAAACKALQLNCTGIVRGEKPSVLSHTLLLCEQEGMRLKFIPRENYSKKQENGFLKNLQHEFGEHILIPEGGFSHEGAEGTGNISQYYSNENYTHICCPVGTGTTLAGLIKKGNGQQKFVGFSAIKNFNDFEIRMKYLLSNTMKNNYSLVRDYHFGGYAKKTDELISFMNDFYEKHTIPTDFVYTGKMMYGIWHLIEQKYFANGSKILCIHTGGLQGNFSLPPGLLNF